MRLSTSVGKHQDIESNPQRVLVNDPAIETAVLLFCRANVTLDRFALKVRGHQRIGSRHERIVLVCVPPRDRRVSRTIHEVMVIEIMGRNPHQRGIAIENRQDVAESIIHPPATECRTMIVIVRDDAASDRQIAAEGR